MSDVSIAEREVQKGVAYLLPLLGANVLPLLTLPILTRALSPSDYGLLALATVYAAVATGLGQLGLAQGFEREFFEHRRAGGSATLLFSVALLVTATLVVGGVVTWSIQHWVSIAILREPGHGLLVVVVYIAMSGRVLRQFFLTYYRNRGEAERYARFFLAEAVLWAALSLYLVVVMDMGIIGIPLGQLMGSTLVLIFMWTPIVRLGARLDLAALRGALRIGLPLTPRVLVSVADSHFDKYLLGLLATVGGVGIYSIGQRLAYVVFTYMTALENVFAPRVLGIMFDDAPPHAGVRIGAYLSPFGFLSAAIALLVVLFSEEALWVLVPPEYSGARIVIALLALHYLVMFFTKQKQLLFAKATRLLPFLALVGLTLNIMISIPLIRAFGPSGAALGTMVAGIVSVWVTVSVSQRYYRIEYQRLRMLASFSIPFLAAGSLLSVEFLGLGYSFRLGLKGLWLLVFVVLGWRMGVLSSKNMVTVRRAARGMIPRAIGASTR